MRFPPDLAGGERAPLLQPPVTRDLELVIGDSTLERRSIYSRCGAGWKSLALSALLVLPSCGSMRNAPPTARLSSAGGSGAPRDQLVSTEPETSASRPAGPLDLEDALALADEHHPEIQAARAYLQAAAGRVDQAGTWLNPRLEASMDAAPFDGRTTGDAEYLVGATQTLPVGGRLDAATTAARAEETRRTFEATTTRRRVHALVRRTFFSVLYTERLVAAERELLETAEAAVSIARAKVSAGEGIPEDVSRAALEAEGTRLRLRRSEAALEEARLVLAESMGRPGMTVSELQGDLYDSLEAPALEELLERAREHPELLAAAAKLDESRARLRLAEVERVPDVEVGFAYHRFEATDTDAFDVGFGIPLPFFSQNRGAIAEARANLEAARAEARSRRASIETRARLIHQRLREALRAVTIYREELVPRAETVLASAEARYAAGDVSLAELLPVRRDAARLKLEALDAVRELTMRWSELEELARVE